MEEEYDFAVSAAGRVNIIGEHIDYCGGKVLPAALSLKNTVYVRKNNQNKVNIRWTTLPDEVSLPLNNLASAKTLRYGNYQAGSLLAWSQAGHTLVGCDMLMDCTVPFGSGLSSSAAIEVSTIAAMATVAGEKFNPVEVALSAQKAEREFVGVNCGIMDQYISACGKRDHAVLLDCKTLQREYVPMQLGKYALLILDSRKPHDLIVSKYNERREETEQALALLQQKLPVTCLADITREQFEEVKGCLPPLLQKRALHVVSECERVFLAHRAMKNGKIEELGQLLNRSHESLSQLFEVTGTELDCLAHEAQKYPACIGARMTGGGFGGSVIALVEKGREEEFFQTVAQNYQSVTGYTPKCYPASVADGIIIQKIK